MHTCAVACANQDDQACSVPQRCLGLTPVHGLHPAMTQQMEAEYLCLVGGGE